jgi:transcription antitermination factor NusG
MTWHVIRLATGALRPHKLFTGFTVVERSLRDAGISFYLPFEHRTIVHPKTKKKIARDFPLMPGYGFVEGVTNFEALRQCDGVTDVIKSAGRPVPIRASVVSDVMEAEQAVNAEHARKEAAQAAREALGTRASVSQAFPVNSRARVKPGHLLAGQEVFVSAATGRATIKGVIEALNGMAVEIDATHLEAAE